jgi:hypothetical protein
MLGANCPLAKQDRIKEILKVENIDVEKKYLGLPTSKGRMNKDKFKLTKERLAKRFTCWDEKYMLANVRGQRKYFFYEQGKGSADQVSCVSNPNICHESV